MTNKSWKTLKSEVFKQTPWTTFRHNEFEMPNGKKGDYYFVDSPGSSFIIPITREGKIVLIKQYRYLTNENSIEFPGGGADDGDSYEKTAGKELEEETGYRAESLAYVGEFVPMNGVTNEKCEVFIARGLQKGEVFREATEDGMEVFEVSVEELERMIRENIIRDGQTLASWQLAKNILKYDGSNKNKNVVDLVSGQYGYNRFKIHSFIPVSKSDRFAHIIYSQVR